MMLIFRKLVLFIAVVFTGFTAQAGGDLAIIIVNQDYRSFADVDDAFAVTIAARELQQAGFSTQIIRNMSRKDMVRIAPDVRSDIDDADRVLVFVAGQVVSGERESWLLATDAIRRDGLLAGTLGLPMQAIMDIMGAKAGAAVLMVGYPAGINPLLPGLDNGFSPKDIPQGVAVFSGRTSDLVTVLREGLLVEGTTLADVASSAPTSVTALGFISPVVAFLPETTSPAPVSQDSATDELEQLIWDIARTSGTKLGVNTYLLRYPEGRFADDARELLAEMDKSPVDLAKELENSLELSREARRDIQRDLSLLGFDTRGIDGIFGRGSRAAVMAWQRQSDVEETGYLSGNQITALNAEAAVRAEELEEEARKRREEQDRLDATFWRSTGRDSGEAGLRAYLKRYPDGLYSEIAADRLEVYDEERRRTAAIAESNAWDVALEANTAAGFENFLNRFPNGTFTESAREKLAELKKNQKNGAAKQEEQRVMNNSVTRLLVERKLAKLGFKPGKVDGKIDESTRKAIRRFQRSSNLAVSGYVTQATIIRLLAVK